MGLQNIIKKAEEESASPKMVIQNDPFFDDEDPPVVIQIYSDSSSDTESFSVLSDAEELLDFIEFPSAHSSCCNLDNEREQVPQVEVQQPCSQPCEPQYVVENENKIIVNSTQRRVKCISSRAQTTLGKKKARRLENARQLDLLVGEENHGDCDANDFMPSDCSFRFSQILEDSDLTNKILNPTIDIPDDSRLEEDNVVKRKPRSTKTTRLSAEDAFNNLYASEKTLLKRRNLPRGMVVYLDTCVLSFFENNPTGTYISEPLSSFERMMLHSIAHYYELNSYSFNADNFRKARYTRVTNNFNYFNPPCLGLSEYLEKLLLLKNSCGPVRRRRLKKK